MTHRSNSRKQWWRNHYAKLRSARGKPHEPDLSSERTIRVPVPRLKARFRILIEDCEVGDRLQLRLYKTPFRGEFATDTDLISVRKLERAVGHILRTAFKP